MILLLETYFKLSVLKPHWLTEAPKEKLNVSRKEASKNLQTLPSQHEEVLSETAISQLGFHVSGYWQNDGAIKSGPFCSRISATHHFASAFIWKTRVCEMPVWSFPCLVASPALFGQSAWDRDTQWIVIAQRPVHTTVYEPTKGLCQYDFQKQH